MSRKIEKTKSLVHTDEALRRDRRRRRNLQRRIEKIEQDCNDKTANLPDDLKHEAKVRGMVGRATRSMEIVIEGLSWIEAEDGWMKGETFDSLMKLLRCLCTDLQAIEDPSTRPTNEDSETNDVLAQLTSDFARSSIKDEVHATQPE